jgi:multidrug resistance efflux pump
MQTSSPVKTTSDAGSPLRDRVRSLQLPPLEEKRGFFNGTTIGVIVLVVALGGAWYWWQGRDKTADEEPPVAAAPSETVKSKPESAAPASDVPKSPSARTTPSLTTTTVTPTPPAAPRGGIALESKGYIIPAHRILVSPKVSGMLMSLTVEEGVRVKKGDVLGVIESVEYEADLKRAEASLDLANAKLQELQAGGRVEEVKRAAAELDEAKETMKRVDADFKRAQQLIQGGSVTRAEFDQYSAEYQAQLARIERLTYALELIRKPARDEQIAQAKAQVEQAEADVQKAKWRLENCTIRSPISGTILKKNAEEGNIVNAVAFNGSYSVCDMADLSDLEVELNIQERDVSKVFQDQKCKVRAEAYPNRVYDGYVSRLMPIADRAKGAVPVRVKVTVPADEEGVYLKPDMGAIVTFYGSAEG